MVDFVYFSGRWERLERALGRRPDRRTGRRRTVTSLTAEADPHLWWRIDFPATWRKPSAV